MSQYALPLSLPAIYAEGNFVVSGCNREAHRYVLSWPAWNMLLLTGPDGSGKTHLGHLWSGRAKADMVPADALAPEKIGRHTLIEDIEHADPETLLHAINYSREKKYSLLLTAGAPAGALPFTLPDLTSRLKAMPMVSIGTPDDEALAGALRKQFADRQMKISEEVVHYLLNHTERSFTAIQDTVGRLDQQALELGRSLTVPLVRKLLSHAAD